MGYRVNTQNPDIKHPEYREGYRVNIQNTDWVIGKTYSIQSRLLGKHIGYKVGYRVNT